MDQRVPFWRTDDPREAAAPVLGRLPGSPPALGDLLYRVLELELVGVRIYPLALRCAQNVDLRAEWQAHLSETGRHLGIARSLLSGFALDPDAAASARLPTRIRGQALAAAMERGLGSGSEIRAQLIAAGCVAEAAARLHRDWELIGRLSQVMGGEAARRLSAAYERVEGEEGRHARRASAWARELWLDALGLPAVFPPPRSEGQDGPAMC